METHDLINCSVEPVDIMDSGVFSSSTGLAVFSIYFFLVCLFAVVENAIILAAIIRVKRLHKRRNILIFNLALTDLMAGVIYPCSVIFNKTYMESIGLIVGIASGFTILAIAAERFLKIVVYTNSCSTHVVGTTRQLVGVSIIVWLIPSAILLPISFYDYILHRVIFFTLGPMCIVVIMAGISILYFAIFLKIHSHDKRMSASLNREGKYKFTQMVLRAYLVILVVYAICWLPWAIESLRIMFTMYYGIETDEQCIVSSLAFYIGVAMVLLNSAVNPIIYWRRLPDFREGISELFGCCTKEKSCCYYRQSVVLADSSVQNTGPRSTNSTVDVQSQTNANKIHDSMC